MHLNELSTLQSIHTLKENIRWLVVAMARNEQKELKVLSQIVQDKDRHLVYALVKHDKIPDYDMEFPSSRVLEVLGPYDQEKFDKAALAMVYDPVTKIHYYKTGLSSTYLPGALLVMSLRPV